MDYKKTNAPATTVTRDMMELCADTGNVYETVAIIGKRANQISVCLLYTSPCALPKMLILVFCVELYPIRIEHTKL